MRLVVINEADNCSPIDESNIITERRVNLKAVRNYFEKILFFFFSVMTQTDFLISFLFTAFRDLLSTMQTSKVDNSIVAPSFVKITIRMTGAQKKSAIVGDGQLFWFANAILMCKLS